MIENREFQVKAEEDGLRLDRFLHGRLPTTSRHRIMDAIAGQEVTVNQRPAFKGMSVRIGDRVWVYRLWETSDLHVVPDAWMPLEVLYEDTDVIAVNKPAGVPVHPLRPAETRTLANALVALYPETAQVGDLPCFPGFAHRLDTDTSGVLIAARHAAAFTALRRQFQSRKVTKIYLALVSGRVEQERQLEHRLLHDPRNPGRMVVVPPSDPDRYAAAFRARCSFRVVERLREGTLLEVQLETGVTHQIRCQLAAVGHPVAGDRLYGDPSCGSRPLARQFLHAVRLELAHPIDRTRRLVISAPLPADLAESLAVYRATSHGGTASPTGR